MQIFLGILSVLLGVTSFIQFLQSIATGSSITANAQAAFNKWYRVAEIADQIKANPQKAAELISHVSGIADVARSEIAAYSREKLSFVPWYDPAYKPGDSPRPAQNLLQKAKFAFVPK